MKAGQWLCERREAGQWLSPAASRAVAARVVAIAGGC